jgi:hypothetical protein
LNGQTRNGNYERFDGVHYNPPASKPPPSSASFIFNAREEFLRLSAWISCTRLLYRGVGTACLAAALVSSTAIAAAQSGSTGHNDKAVGSKHVAPAGAIASLQ